MAEIGRNDRIYTNRRNYTSDNDSYINVDRMTGYKGRQKLSNVHATSKHRANHRSGSEEHIEEEFDDDLEYLGDDVDEYLGDANTNYNDRRNDRRSVDPARSEVASSSDFTIPALPDSQLDQEQSDLGDGGDNRRYWNPSSQDEVNQGLPLPSTTQQDRPRGLKKLFASFKSRKRNGSTHNERPVNAKLMTRVIMLDGEEVSFPLSDKDTGQKLFNHVVDYLDLVETDYFGLTFVDNRQRTWVKFYPPEPSLLQEDLTRYLLTLQLRQDIFTGKLPCLWVTQALFGSFQAQAEIGDHGSMEGEDAASAGIDYLTNLEIVPNPSPQLMQKIAELHKTHRGMKASEADLKYLETAKRLELYGVDLHPARDSENVEIYIGVGFHGIVIYRDKQRIGRFAWPKVLSIKYEKNNFYLKIRPDYSDPVTTLIGFRLLNHQMARRLWSTAVEHHVFFRLKEVKDGDGGDKIKHGGRTFYQYQTSHIQRPHRHQFNRSLSKRQYASLPGSLDKSVSLHNLNRPHPRDMTVGRTQKSDEAMSYRSRSTLLLDDDNRSQRTPSIASSQPSRRRRGYTRSQRGPSDEGSEVSSSLARRQIDESPNSLSYASPVESSRLTDSSNVDSPHYVNQHRQPASSGGGRRGNNGQPIGGYYAESELSNQSLAASSGSSQQAGYRSNHRIPPSKSQKPPIQSPLYVNASAPRRPTTTNHSQQQSRQQPTIDSDQSPSNSDRAETPTNAIKTSHNKNWLPAGAVPVMGGLLASQDSQNSSSPKPKPRSRRLFSNVQQGNSNEDLHQEGTGELLL